jgi:hypothetical protein
VFGSDGINAVKRKVQSVAKERLKMQGSSLFVPKYSFVCEFLQVTCMLRAYIRAAACPTTNDAHLTNKLCSMLHVPWNVSPFCPDDVETDRLSELQATEQRCIMFPVRYELNLYMLCRRK